jgi:hypothetical protein
LSWLRGEREAKPTVELLAENFNDESAGVDLLFIRAARSLARRAIL